MQMTLPLSFPLLLRVDDGLAGSDKVGMAISLRKSLQELFARGHSYYASGTPTAKKS